MCEYRGVKPTCEMKVTVAGPLWHSPPAPIPRQQLCASPLMPRFLHYDLLRINNNPLSRIPLKYPRGPTRLKVRKPGDRGDKPHEEETWLLLIKIQFL